MYTHKFMKDEIFQLTGITLPQFLRLSKDEIVLIFDEAKRIRNSKEHRNKEATDELNNLMSDTTLM